MHIPLQNKKTVSVIMCTYNGEKYIREQLDSILLQTLQPKEIIIIDDCSTDSTYQILCNYKERHPNLIQLERNNQNLGINKNFFKAMNMATSNYIAISDQDDIWEPNKIEEQIRTINNNLMCVCASRPFTTTNAALRWDKRIPNYSLLRQVFVGCLPGHTMLISKKILDLIPNIDNMHRYYDVILSMVAEAYCSITYIDKVLVHHRMHITSATYTPPTDNTMNFKNILKNIIQTWKHYRLLKSKIRIRLLNTLTFLEQIKSNTTELENAKKILRLYISKSTIDFMQLQWFCIKHYKNLFYTSVKFSPISIMRAAYFPISCSMYFRYLL